ncbi:MAG TPA: hypothetical protein VNX68_16795, partial [Nitrosopumilaceae archaeon]|nr:hypothetical protein [Nitrosopumilaceae archaeon]
MSIQNKYDLTLLGNIIFDEIYCVNRFDKCGTSNILQNHQSSIGGIGNIIRSLDKQNLNIFVEAVIGNEAVQARKVENFFHKYSISTQYHYSDKPSSLALIVSDLESVERTSFVRWGCGTDQFIPQKFPTKWTHIAYLDASGLFDLKQIHRYSSIVSADLCLSNRSLETD